VVQILPSSWASVRLAGCGRGRCRGAVVLLDVAAASWSGGQFLAPRLARGDRRRATDHRQATAGSHRACGDHREGARGRWRDSGTPRSLSCRGCSGCCVPCCRHDCGNATNGWFRALSPGSFAICPDVPPPGDDPGPRGGCVPTSLVTIRSGSAVERKRAHAAGDDPLSHARSGSRLGALRMVDDKLANAGPRAPSLPDGPPRRPTRPGGVGRGAPGSTEELKADLPEDVFFLPLRISVAQKDTSRTANGVGLGHPVPQTGLTDPQILRRSATGLAPSRANSTARRRNSGGCGAGTRTSSLVTTGHLRSGVRTTGEAQCY
jgi:hypothetical protein